MNSPGFLFVLAVVPAVAILAYYLFTVRSAPEPPLAVAACCLVGGLGFFAAAEIEPRLAVFVPRSAAWAWAFGVVAPVEELVKLATIFLVTRPARYERVSSGIVYGVAAGAAFACVENVAYVGAYGATTGVLRAATAVPAHALHGAIIGLGVGLWHRTERRAAVVLITLLLAIALHGTYDGLLLGAEALRGGVVAVVFLEAIAVHYTLRRVLERDLQEDIDRLASAPIFAGVPAASLRRLAAGATRQRVPAGAFVVKQGRAGDAMFQIMRGRVTVRVDDAHVGELASGAFFGELALLTGAPRSADVIAAEETRVLRVPRTTLLDAVHGDLGLARVVVERARALLPHEHLVTPETLAHEADAVAPADTLAERLAKSPLLADLPADDLSALARACVTTRARTGATLVRAGRVGPGLCVVLFGQAEVLLEREQVWLAEGDAFGEISLLTGWSATATVVARSPVELAVLRWIDLERVLAVNPALGRRLLDGARTHLSRERGAAPITPLTAAVWIALGRAGRALSPWDAKTEAVFSAFPSVRSLPRSAVETLARIASAEHPSHDAIVLRAGTDQWGIDPQDLLDGIARCPNVVRFLARELVRATVASMEPV